MSGEFKRGFKEGTLGKKKRFGKFYILSFSHQKNPPVQFLLEYGKGGHPILHEMKIGSDCLSFHQIEILGQLDNKFNIDLTKATSHPLGIRIEPNIFIIKIPIEGDNWKYVAVKLDEPVGSIKEITDKMYEGATHVYNGIWQFVETSAGFEPPDLNSEEKNLLGKNILFSHGIFEISPAHIPTEIRKQIDERTKAETRRREIYNIPFTFINPAGEGSRYRWDRDEKIFYVKGPWNIGRSRAIFQRWHKMVPPHNVIAL